MSFGVFVSLGPRLCNTPGSMLPRQPESQGKMGAHSPAIFFVFPHVSGHQACAPFSS